MQRLTSFPVIERLLWAVVALRVIYVLATCYTGAHLQGLDPDTWLHLTRLRELFLHGNWFDTVIARDNTPYGITTHWSRLLDALALPLVWLGQWVMPLQESLLVLVLWWNTLVLLCLLLPLLLVTARKAARTPYAQDYVLAGVALGLFYFSLYSPRQFDYHTLLAALCVALVALAYPREGGRDNALAMGAIAGLGVWLSVEFLLPVFLCLAWLGCRWLRNGELSPLWRMSAGLCIVTCVAFLCEQPPAAWMQVEHDSLSIVQLAAISLNLLLLSGLSFINPRLRSGASRMGFAAALVLALGALLTALFPGFWQGPLSAMSDMLAGSYMWRIGEMRPLYENFSPALLVGAYLAVIALPWCFRRACYTQAQDKDFYLLLGGMLLCFLVAMAFQTRWISYAVPLSTLLLALWLDALITRYGWNARRARWTVLLLALAPLFIYAAETRLQRQDAAVTFAPDCYAALEKAIQQDYLASITPMPQRVMVPENYGTMVLFFTPHSIVASNYHRNTEGILDQERFFRAPTAGAARDVVRRRGIDYLLLCPPTEAAKADYPFLYQLTQEQALPAWLQAVEHPWQADDLRIFRVKEE